MVNTAYDNPEVKVGQADLTDHEKQAVDWAGPPENGRPNIIEAQVIKALAQYYEINDWMAQWDRRLSPEENARIFQRRSTRVGAGGPTTRTLHAVDKAVMRRQC